MRKIIAVSAIGVALTLGLAACGSTPAKIDPSKPAETPVSAPSAAPASTPKPKPTEEGQKKNSRGNLVMEGGTFGTISNKATGEIKTKIAVNAITPIACQPPSYGGPAKTAENGQIVVVDVVVETTPELAKDSYPKFTLSGHDFKYIAQNGTTFNGSLSSIATYSCIPDAETFPSAGMGPNEKVTAKVVLDVPAAHGTLVMLGNYGTGFEYGF